MIGFIMTHMLKWAEAACNKKLWEERPEKKELWRKVPTNGQKNEEFGSHVGTSYEEEKSSKERQGIRLSRSSWKREKSPLMEQTKSPRSKLAWGIDPTGIGIPCVRWIRPAFEIKTILLCAPGMCFRKPKINGEIFSTSNSFFQMKQKYKSSFSFLSFLC